MLTIPPHISSAAALRGLCGSFLFFSTVSVIGRLIARTSQKSRYRADDWVMILAWLAFTGLCSCVIAATYEHTLGYSPAEAAPYNPSPIINGALTIAIDQTGALCLGFVKISALLFYRRVFCVKDAKSAFRTIVNTCIVVVALWIITFMVFPLSYCGTHIDGFWNRPDYNKYCKPAHEFLISQSATDLILDIFVVILPIPKIWGLQTTVRRRIAVLLIFLTALLSLGASTAKMAIVGTLAVNPVTDEAVAAFANSSIFFMWAFEAGAAIVAINMPSLWYFHSRKLPEKIVQSFRSMVSLRSTASRGSQGSNRQTKASKDVSRVASTARGSDDVYRMEEGKLSYSKDEITVTSQISQVVERH